MPLKIRRHTRKKLHSRRKRKTHRRRRGGNGTVSVYGSILSENEFNKHVRNGTLYQSVNPLD